MAAPAVAKGKKSKTKMVTSSMTVARIRPSGKDQTFISVTFDQSQRFYKLPNSANPAYLELLKASEASHTPVIIKRATQASDVILSVQKK